MTEQKHDPVNRPRHYAALPAAPAARPQMRCLATALVKQMEER